MQWKIFVSFPINAPEIYEPLTREGFKLIFGAEPADPLSSERKVYREKEIIEKCRDVHAILSTPRLPLNGNVLNSAESLFCICQRGIGFDNVDVETASRLGILVTNTPIELEFISVAEHTVALIIALAKRLKAITNIISLEPTSYFDKRVDTATLMGKTVGIIGIGRIGSKVALLLRHFNVKLLGYTRTQNEEKAESLGVKLVDLDTLLKESDFVTIHVPLTAETRHMIGERELSLMKSTAYLINTARGAIIDEKALIKALKSGRIAGAALDVLEKEPATPDNPLLRMDNVLITPHIAGRNSETLIEGEKTAVKNCLKILKGIIPEHVINPNAIQKWKERMKIHF